MNTNIDTVDRLAEMTDLTLDAYQILTQAVTQIIDHIPTQQRETLIRALEETTLILNLAVSP